MKNKSKRFDTHTIIETGLYKYKDNIVSLGVFVWDEKFLDLYNTIAIKLSHIKKKIKWYTHSISLNWLYMKE